MGDASPWTWLITHSPEYYRKEIARRVDIIFTMKPKDTPAAGESTRLTWYK